MTQLHVDWTRCDGHGACAEVLTETFASDGWKYLVSLGGEREPQSAAMRSRARVAPCAPAQRWRRIMERA